MALEIYDPNREGKGPVSAKVICMHNGCVSQKQATVMRASEKC